MKAVYKNVRYKAKLNKDKATVELDGKKISLEDIDRVELTSLELMEILTDTKETEKKVESFNRKPVAMSDNTKNK